MKLNKEEMKNVFGGQIKQIICTYYRESGGALQWPCNGSLDDCQSVADSLCDPDDNCINVDCR
jgi:hypothetical protein